MKNFTLTFAACMLLNVVLIYAQQPGSLDTTFSKDGKQTTAPGEGFISFNIISSAIQTDGKIVVAGSYSSENAGGFLLIRYHQHGKIDSSFGDNGDGIVTTQFGEGAAYGNSVAIQQDGRIVVAGSLFSSSGNKFAIAQYKPNGRLDTAFGNMGKIITNPVSGSQAYSVALQSDGKIVVAGTSGGRFCIIRYNKNGKSDNSFATNGTALFFPQGSIAAVAIQPDGKIVAAGYASNNDAFALARCMPDGRLDSTLGKKGYITTRIQRHDHANSVAIQADGKIVVSGNSQAGSNTDFALVRYNKNGKPDSTFGENGIAIHDFGLDDFAGSIAIQTDGKILSAGSTGTDFALLRYNTNGETDSSFGDNGKVITSFKNANSGCRSVRLQADGKIVLAGGNSNGFVCLARYNSGDLVSPAKKNNVANLIQTGNNLIKPATIYLSPNPAEDILYIKNLSPSDVSTISILNLSGVVLQKATALNTAHSFYVKQLPAGIYFIRIEENKKITTLKFIKSN
jgi:uncharacterized delta-60 repeat protein